MPVSSWTPKMFYDLYTDDPIGARVVECMPKECWSRVPDVFEDDDANVITPFEQAWQDLCKGLRGRSWFEGQEGNPIWEFCKRLDIQSGIGEFGVMLLGFSDGLPLSQPVKGFKEPTFEDGIATWNALKPKIKPKRPVVEEEEAEDESPMPAEDGESPSNPAGEDPEGLQNDPTQPQQPGELTPTDEDMADAEELDEEGNPIQEEPAWNPSMRLMYVRVFPQTLVQISTYETDVKSPRYGQPKEYSLTMNDPTQATTTQGTPQATVKVHWSRVIHVADNLGSSEVIGASRMRVVRHRLVDLKKIYGGDSEGYWKNCFATLAAETHPQLGSDVKIDKAALKEQVTKWQDSLQRVLLATGLTWKTLAPMVVDPTSHINVHIEAICIVLEIPMRIFKGSERGELASSQDTSTWDTRVTGRRNNYITPRIIIPLIDRLITVGCLPEPESYKVVWPDKGDLTDQERATLAQTMVGAMVSYISGGGNQLVDPVTFFTKFFGWSDDEARTTLEAAQQYMQEMQAQQAMQGGGAPVDPNTGMPLEQDPATGEYIDPNTGQPMPMDEQGNPVATDPETGEPLPPEQQPQMQGDPNADPNAQTDAEGSPNPSGALEDSGQGDNEVGQEEAQEVDEATGLPIDPESGLLVDEENGRLIDPDTGDVIDAKTGQVIGNVNEQEKPTGNAYIAKLLEGIKK